MMNNKNQGRSMPLGIAPPLKSRDQIRAEFVEQIRVIRSIVKRYVPEVADTNQHLHRLMESGCQGFVLNYAIGFREGRGEQ